MGEQFGCDIASGDDILVIQFNRPVRGEEFYQIVGAISKAIPQRKILFVNGVDVEQIVVISANDRGAGGESIYGEG